MGNEIMSRMQAIQDQTVILGQILKSGEWVINELPKGIRYRVAYDDKVYQTATYFDDVGDDIKASVKDRLGRAIVKGDLTVFELVQDIYCLPDGV